MRNVPSFPLQLPGKFLLAGWLLASPSVACVPMEQGHLLEGPEEAAYGMEQGFWEADSLEEVEYASEQGYWENDQDSLEELLYPWQLDTFERKWVYPGQTDSIPPLRRMDDAAWHSATQDLDYQESTRPTLERQTSNSTGQFPVLIIYGLLALVLLLIFLAIIRYFRSRDKSDLPGTDARQATEDDELPAQWDLHALRAKALSQADWAAAYRWSFLLLLADLTQRNWIAWTRDGTNRRYAQELTALGEPALVQEFRQLGIAFERIRYGQGTMDQAGFEVLDKNLMAFQERAAMLPRNKQPAA